MKGGNQDIDTAHPVTKQLAASCPPHIDGTQGIIVAHQVIERPDNSDRGIETVQAFAVAEQVIERPIFRSPSSSTDSTEGNGKKQGNSVPKNGQNVFNPTPVDLIIRPAPKPQVILPPRPPSKYVADSDGILILSSYPSCFEVCYMLPIFCFIGCCTSATTRTIFDNSKDMVYSQTAMGYFYVIPCFRTNHTFSYDDIGNIGYKIFSDGGDDSSPSYRPVIILKNGICIQFAAINSYEEVQEDVLGLHKFIFGRNNPHYAAPLMYSLEVPGGDCCERCCVACGGCCFG